mgnify:CR=1 FL=1
MAEKTIEELASDFTATGGTPAGISDSILTPTGGGGGGGGRNEYVPPYAIDPYTSPYIRPRVVVFTINTYANLSKIDKKHLNYIITANGNTSLPPYQFYAADILEKMRYKDIRGAFVYRNLKTLFTSVVNLSIYSDFDENIIPAKKIINLLNSRGIARMMPSNTNDIYTYTPLYKLYPNPADELKRLYDSNYFGTPKK